MPTPRNTRLMERRDDGMKRSMGLDCGGCTRRPRRWGIGVIGVVVRKECFGRFYLIAKLKCEMYVPPMQTTSRAMSHHPMSIMSHCSTSEL